MADAVIAVSELGKCFDEILERVENGERILIARDGIPFLQLTPFSSDTIPTADKEG